MRSSSPFVSSPGMQPISSPYNRPIQVPASMASFPVQQQGVLQQAVNGSGVPMGQQVSSDGVIYMGTAEQYGSLGRVQFVQQQNTTRTQSPMPSPFLLPSMSPAYPTPSASPMSKPLDHMGGSFHDRQSHFSLLSGPANGSSHAMQTHSLDLRQKRKSSLTGAAPTVLRVATANLTFSDARNIFQILDVIGRGAITQSEFIRGLRHFGDVAGRLGLLSEARQGEEVRQLFGAKFGRSDTSEDDVIDQAEFCRFFAGGILPLPLNPTGGGGRRQSYSAVNSPPAPSLLPPEQNRAGTPRRHSLSLKAPPLIGKVGSAPAISAASTPGLYLAPLATPTPAPASPEAIRSSSNAFNLTATVPGALNRGAQQHVHAQQQQAQQWQGMPRAQQQQLQQQLQQQQQQQQSQRQSSQPQPSYQADEFSFRASENFQRMPADQQQGSVQGQASWRGSVQQQHRETTGLTVRRDRAGTLFAFDGSNEEWKLRMFSLKDSVLAYSEFQPMGSMRPVGKPTLIQLFSGTLVEAMNKPMFGRACCFSVRTRQDGDVFLLSAESKEERGAWLQVLEDAGCTCRFGEGDVDNSLRFWMPFLFGEPMF